MIQIIFICFVYFGGAYSTVLRGALNSVITLCSTSSSIWDARNQNLGWLHEKKMPYLLYHCPSSKVIQKPFFSVQFNSCTKDYLICNGFIHGLTLTPNIKYRHFCICHVIRTFSSLTCIYCLQDLKRIRRTKRIYAISSGQ